MPKCVRGRYRTSMTELQFLKQGAGQHTIEVRRGALANADAVNHDPGFDLVLRGR